MIKRLDINGTSYIGVLARANDKIALVPSYMSDALVEEFRTALNVEVVRMTIGGANLVGSLTAFNSYGLVVSDIVEKSELARLPATLGTVLTIDDRLNATGNIILANDHFALVHPELENSTIEAIQRTLNVPVEKGTIAGLVTVGSAALVTSKGILCHPKTTDQELLDLERKFKVPAKIGTANYGCPMIGACVAANRTKCTPVLPAATTCACTNGSSHSRSETRWQSNLGCVAITNYTQHLSWNSNRNERHSLISNREFVRSCA